MVITKVVDLLEFVMVLDPSLLWQRTCCPPACWDAMAYCCPSVMRVELSESQCKLDMHVKSHISYLNYLSALLYRCISRKKTWYSVWFIFKSERCFSISV